MTRAIIIDDEQHCTDTLQLQIERYCPEIRLVAVTNDPLEGVNLIRELKPELVFLDIEMRHLNGFGVLEQTRDLDFGVIFTTAYDEFAINAIKHSALDYLLKPIDKDELVEAVRKAGSKRNGTELRQHIDQLFDRLNTDQNFELSRIPLPTQESIEIVYLKDIIRCEADSNYTTVFLIGGGKIIVSKTLKDIDEMIHSRYFFRAHKSHLVNLLQAKKYLRGIGGSLIMSDGSEVPVARTKKDELVEWLEGQ